MPSKAVKDAVDARLATWSNVASCPHHDVNDLANSPADTFIDTEYPVANEERVSIGTPALFREHGAIRFVIYVSALDGVDQALTWSDEVRDLFRDRDDFAGVPGLQTFEASPPIFDRSFTQGGYFQVPFVVTYQHDYEK